jgi:hypothetical protein
MHPYWITLERRPAVGITARSEADALELFRLAFGSQDQVIGFRALSDLTELDQRHVVPNMGNWLKRGIWYPLGYEHI